MSDGAGDDNKSQFRKPIETVINSHSMENGSDTPDYILAEYLVGCLEAFDRAVTRRTAWYSRGKEPVSLWPAPVIGKEHDAE
jgi:hypothetical protein